MFQQRPYPSPGAVLRRNAETASSQKKKPNSHFTEITKRGDGKDGLGDADLERERERERERETYSCPVCLIFSIYMYDLESSLFTGLV